MSAEKNEILRIRVTNGDVFDENRLHGKSLTGTYFISNLKEFEENYTGFFDSKNQFSFDIFRISKYSVLLKYYYDSFLKDKFPKIAEHIKFYANSFRYMEDDPIVLITLRKNDSRVFMRFTDNLDLVVNSFRHILYGEFTNIVLEKHGNKIKIYPEINFNIFELGGANND